MRGVVVPVDRDRDASDRGAVVKRATKADDKITFKGKSYSVQEFVAILDIGVRVHSLRGTPYYAKAVALLKRKAVAR